jgi:hypothetical protein
MTLLVRRRVSKGTLRTGCNRDGRMVAGLYGASCRASLLANLILPMWFRWRDNGGCFNLVLSSELL